MADDFEFEPRPMAQKGAPDNALEVASELTRIERQNGGRLRPGDVVAAAANPRNPLHKHFEWDDTEAAQQWRLAQARSLIASVRVSLEDSPERPPMRAFVHVPEMPPYYQSAHLAMSNEATRELILRRAMGEIQSVRQRYAELSELAEVFAAIDEASARLAPPPPAKRAKRAKSEARA